MKALLELEETANAVSFELSEFFYTSSIGSSPFRRFGFFYLVHACVEASFCGVGRL